MNALFNSALKRSTAIRKDLDALADAQNPSPALLGQISASLTSFSRTVDDYNKLAKQELVPDKQTKAFERIKTFRAEQQDYRDQFNRLKKETDERQTVQARTELLGRRPHHAATPENPYSDASISANAHANSVFQPSNPSIANPYANATREQHTLRESSFMSSTNNQLDEFLDRGRAVLGDLGHQRELLKGTQRRLYGVANTLGISGDTIRMVERRAKQDKWIFWGGVVVFFLFCWLVIHYLR